MLYTGCFILELFSTVFVKYHIPTLQIQNVNGCIFSKIIINKIPFASQKTDAITFFGDRSDFSCFEAEKPASIHFNCYCLNSGSQIRFHYDQKDSNNAD